MMTLPASAQRWMVHHPVLPVMVLVAATIATAQVGGPILLALAWVPALFAAGCYMAIEHSALRRHDPETCPRCDEEVADRHAAVLRRHHRLTRPVLVVGTVILGCPGGRHVRWRGMGVAAHWPDRAPGGVDLDRLRAVAVRPVHAHSATAVVPVVHNPNPTRRHPTAGALTVLDETGRRLTPD
jgi:hypothetical protein